MGVVYLRYVLWSEDHSVTDSMFLSSFSDHCHEHQEPPSVWIALALADTFTIIMPSEP